MSIVPCSTLVIPNRPKLPSFGGMKGFQLNASHFSVITYMCGQGRNDDEGDTTYIA